VLDDVRLAVTDWKQMRDKLLGVVAEIDARPPPLPAEEIAECKAFLSWLADDHYTFLAYRCHDLVVVDGQDALKVVPARAWASCARSPRRTWPPASRRCRRKFARTPASPTF
jgi:glutamate dehydrogenase